MYQAGRVSFFFFKAVPLCPKTPFFTFTRDIGDASPLVGVLIGLTLTLMAFDAPRRPFQGLKPSVTLSKTGLFFTAADSSIRSKAREEQQKARNTTLRCT